MNKIVPLFAAALLSACAATEDTVGKDQEQAVRDFIAVRQLAEVDRVRTPSIFSTALV